MSRTRRAWQRLTYLRVYYQDCYGNINTRHISRDRKPWWKPSSWFKHLKRRVFKAKCKHALIAGKDVPRDRQSDRRDWN